MVMWSKGAELVDGARSERRFEKRMKQPETDYVSL
jgi:hypothetical protein